jgi:hypothetical protein
MCRATHWIATDVVTTYYRVIDRNGSLTVLLDDVAAGEVHFVLRWEFRAPRPTRANRAIGANP